MRERSPAGVAVAARAWKVLRQKEVYRFTRREREPARLFEMKGARSFGDLLAAQQLAVIFAFDACHDVSPLCAGLREQAMRRRKILMRPSKNGSLRVFRLGGSQPYSSISRISPSLRISD